MIKIGDDIFKDMGLHRLLHETSRVDGIVTIGKGTKIWHFSHILEGATIGAFCTIGQNCFIAGQIGNRCKIQNNVQIFKGVIIEDDVFIGPSVCFTNVLKPRAFLNQKDNFKQTVIKKGATIGAGCTIVCEITIGEYAFVGAGSVVTKSVPPYAMVYGSPAKLKGWVCKNGHSLKMKGMSCGICMETMP